MAVYAIAIILNMKLSVCLIIAFLVAVSATGRADTLLTNIPDGTNNVGITNHYVAQEFSTGSSAVNITDSTLTLDLAGQGLTGSDYAVSIYSDSGTGFTVPSTNLGTFTYSSSTPSGGFSQVTYTASTPVDLAADSQYWVVAAAVESSNNVAWLDSNSTSFSSGAGFSLITNADSPNGGQWFLEATGPSNPLSVELSGNIVAVPEPSTYAFISVGIVLLLSSRSIRRSFARN
jgi:hypothetical protein